MNYKTIQNKITKLITSVGISVSVTREDVLVGKTRGVFVKDEDKTQSSPSTDVEGDQTMFVTVGKAVPTVGDYIEIGLSKWYVKSVEEYKPTNIVIAYKLKLG